MYPSHGPPQQPPYGYTQPYQSQQQYPYPGQQPPQPQYGTAYAPAPASAYGTGYGAYPNVNSAQPAPYGYTAPANPTPAYPYATAPAPQAQPPYSGSYPAAQAAPEVHSSSIGWSVNSASANPPQTSPSSQWGNQQQQYPPPPSYPAPPPQSQQYPQTSPSHQSYSPSAPNILIDTSAPTRPQGNLLATAPAAATGIQINTSAPPPSRPSRLLADDSSMYGAAAQPPAAVGNGPIRIETAWVQPPQGQPLQRILADMSGPSPSSNTYAPSGPGGALSPSSGGRHNCQEISFRDLQFGPKIGGGAFKTVSSGRWRDTACAIGQLTREAADEKDIDELKAELDLLCSLQHPNIVLLLGAVTDPSAPAMCIVTELMSRGSLYDVIHKPKDGGKWRNFKLEIVTDCCNGLNFLHQSGVSHRDIKSLNILIDNKYTAKLTDFGLSKIKKGDVSTMAKTKCGTSLWMAPEVMKGETYNANLADVYSMALVIYEVYAENLPYSDIQNEFQLLIQITQNNKRPDFYPNGETPESVVRLAKSMWQAEPQRPNMREVCRQLEAIGQQGGAPPPPPSASAQPQRPVYQQEIRQNAPTIQPTSTETWKPRLF